MDNSTSYEGLNVRLDASNSPGPYLESIWFLALNILITPVLAFLFSISSQFIQILLEELELGATKFNTNAILWPINISKDFYDGITTIS